MASGRWKLFQDVGQEQALVVRGGLVWFHHVLIAGVEASRSHQVRIAERHRPSHQSYMYCISSRFDCTLVTWNYQT